MQLAAQVLTTKNKEMVTSHITGYLLVKLLNVVLKKKKVFATLSGNFIGIKPPLCTYWDMCYCMLSH